MKKNVFVLALFCIVSMMANAEVAKYCMSYDDFVAGNWKSVDELTAGRTQQVCQMKSGDHRRQAERRTTEERCLCRDVWSAVVCELPQSALQGCQP